MIKLTIALLALIVTGPCAWAHARWRWSPLRALPVALCAQSLFLLLAGYALPFSACVALLAAASVAMWAYALVYVRPARDLALRLVAPCAVLCVLAVLLYDACAGRLYISYDEYSHWGLMVKVIAAYDALPRAGEGAAYIQYTYPPGTAMLPALACTLLGYQEGVAYFGYGVMIFGLLMGIAAKAAQEDARGRIGLPRFAACCAMLFLCMMAVFPLGVLRLFSEPVIALLMALLMMGGTREQPLWEDMLYAALLASAKNTGLILLALCALARLCTQPGRRTLARLGAMLASGAAAAASYRAYCAVQGIGATLSPSHLCENLRALAEGTLDPVYAALPGNFVRFILFDALPQSGLYTCYGFGTCALVFAFAAGLCALHVCIAGERRQALRLWGGVWLSNALYVLFVLASYYFFFETSEAANLAEADRYLTLMPLWTGLLACACIAGERARGRRVWGAAAVCTAVMLPLSHVDMTISTFVTRAYVNPTFWDRIDVNTLADVIRTGLDGQTGARVLCMGHYPYIELHYELAGDADLGKVAAYWSSAAWAGDAQAVRTELEAGDYTHVFIGGLEHWNERLIIDERYAGLNAQEGVPLHDNALYSVERDADGRVRLVYQFSEKEMNDMEQDAS